MGECGGKKQQSELSRRGCSDLYSSVAAEVKVKLIRMRNVRIHSGTSRNVSTAPNLMTEKRTFVKKYVTNKYKKITRGEEKC